MTLVIAGGLLPRGQVGQDVVVRVVGVLAHLLVPDDVLHHKNIHN